MTNPAGSRPMLPGMSEITQPSGRIVPAVEATLQALIDDGLLEPRHTAAAQLALELALAVEHGIASRRASAAALAARELRETLATLPEPAETPDDPYLDFLRDLEAAK